MLKCSGKRPLGRQFHKVVALRKKERKLKGKERKRQKKGHVVANSQKIIAKHTYVYKCI